MNEEDWPSHCPGCGNLMTDEPQEIPGLFSIGTNKGRTVDKTFRDIEAASLVRAEAAGDPSLKITNMRDNLREGDLAVKPPEPSREYTEQVQTIVGEHNPWQQGGVQGVVTAAAQGHQGGKFALQAIQGGASQASLPDFSKLKGKFG
jgi:hypothetical protein